MKKIEGILNTVTHSKRNLVISAVVLLLAGYLIGFIGIKLA